MQRWYSGLSTAVDGRQPAVVQSLTPPVCILNYLQHDTEYWAASISVYILEKALKNYCEYSAFISASLFSIPIVNVHLLSTVTPNMRMVNPLAVP